MLQYLRRNLRIGLITAWVITATFLILFVSMLQSFRRATGAIDVLHPSAHPEWGWRVARALGTGNMSLEPGEGDRAAV